MQAYELADLALNTQIRLDATWLLFLTINSTVIGGAVFVERNFSIFEKSVAIFIYLVISRISYLTAVNSLDILSAIYTDLSKFSVAPEEPGYHVLQQMTKIDLTYGIFDNHWLIMSIYAVGAAISILAIVFVEKISSK